MTQPTTPPKPPHELAARELSGCRYRSVMARRYPDRPHTETTLNFHNYYQFEHDRAASQLPTDGHTTTAAATGRKLTITRTDIFDGTPYTAHELHTTPNLWDTVEAATLEALAAGTRIIENPCLTVDVPLYPLHPAENLPWLPDTLRPTTDTTTDTTTPPPAHRPTRRIRTNLDFLIRADTDPSPDKAHYIPVVATMHRITTPTSDQPWTLEHRIRTIRLDHAGYSEPLTTRGEAHRRGTDSNSLAAAHIFLTEAGLSSGLVGFIGQGSPTITLWDGEDMIRSFLTAVNIPTPTTPRRLRECKGCRFEADCAAELVRMDDISLVIPGSQADRLRDRGIDTVQKLIDARLGDRSIQAYAVRHGIDVIRRPGKKPKIRRRDVELDIDMESYMNRGCYLWGTWDGTTYRPFVTWGDLGTEAEATNFAAFWHWLHNRFADARARGQSYAAYCYGRHGENQWMRRSATTWGGMDTAAGRVPTLDEVDEFISSDHWLDVHEWVHTALIGAGSLGLKTVAPLAGFHWEDDEMNGEASLKVFTQARGIAEDSTPESMQQARHLLLRYNRDDCRATEAVRQWLADRTPGVPLLPQDW